MTMTLFQGSPLLATVASLIFCFRCLVFRWYFHRFWWYFRLRTHPLQAAPHVFAASLSSARSKEIVVNLLTLKQLAETTQIRAKVVLPYMKNVTDSIGRILKIYDVEVFFKPPKRVSAYI